MNESGPLDGYVSPMPAHVMTPEMARRPETEEERAARMARQQELADLLLKWASEDPAYDEHVGALLEEELRKDRYGGRSVDDSAA